MSWRVEGDDPYGAEAFCGAIGYVKFGRNYNRSTHLRLLPTQLAWFAYVVYFFVWVHFWIFNCYSEVVCNSFTH